MNLNQLTPEEYHATAPEDDSRVVILGPTGSGKSQAGTHHLLGRSWHKMPWIIFDPKRDELLNSIGAEEISLTKAIPKRAGLYITHPIAQVDDGDVDNFLAKAWHKRNVGLYFDEGYTVPKTNRAHPHFRIILTQGRALKLPTVVCSQRPSGLDVSVWTEHSYLQAFNLQYEQDQKKVQQFSNIPIQEILPRFHSFWYVAKLNKYTALRPVPDADTIRQLFRDRHSFIRPRRKGFWT